MALEYNAAALLQRIDRIESELRQIYTVLPLIPLDEAPRGPKAGWVVYADGVGWDPGSGEGVYRYTIAGAWAFVG
jgi:hypothetical protein